MNPDGDISVATVMQDGTVRFYGPVPKGGGARLYLRSERYANYGQAKLRADEYEDRERVARASRSR